MVVGAVSSRTELAIVGAGPGGYVAALRAADAGLDVTLIERADLGGTCLNVGCIPSKALIELADTRHRALGARASGLNADVTVDALALRNHLVTVSGQLRQGVQTLLADAGVTVVIGDASIARYDRLSIDLGDQVTHLEFDNLLLATGGRPVELSALPNDHPNVMTSTGALALDALPATMAIIGAGYIGVEIGTAWAKLGVSVTLVDAADSILPAVDAELRTPVQRQLGELGVSLVLQRKATGYEPGSLQLDDGSSIAAEVVVAAVGRQPNSDQAGIDRLPIELTQTGHVRVDQTMKAAPNIYAIGDLVAGPALAHKASAEAEVAVDTILGRSSAFDSVIPAVIYSDPEIMSAGVSISDARRAGLTISRFPLGASARARTIGAITGATYVVSDADETVVGVHAVGPHASELAGEAVLAIEMAATLEDLSLAVHAHPTIGESIAEAAWIGRGHPLHVRR